MITKKEVKTVQLNPEKALEFAHMEPLPGERAVKPLRLEFLRNHVRKGTFYGCDWATATVRGTEKVYRANGQHSSVMLSLIEPEKFPQGLLASITHYEIDSIRDDGYVLFDLFDNPRSARSNEDVMGLERAHHEDLTHIPVKTLVHAAKGIGYARRQANDQLEKQVAKGKDAAQLKFATVFPDRTSGAYFQDESNRRFAIWLHRLTETNKLTMPFVFSMAGEVGAMHNDWKASEEGAAHFWAMVISESHPDPEHITREFAVKLRTWHSEKRKQQEDYFKEARKVSRRFFEVMKVTNASYLPPVDEPSQQAGA